MLPRLILAVLAAAIALAAPPLAAQNLFAPVAKVNERVVTVFEVDQRARMLELFNTPGDLQTLALEALIDERLQIAEARQLGISVSQEQLQEGMEEFASRANLTRQEFVQALGGAGVDVTTFEDFVRAGIAWREVVRQRFGGRVDIADSVIARAVDGPPPTELRFLLSEIILPANNPENVARTQELLPRLTDIRSQSEFSAAAQEYSAAPTRDRGGRIDWMAASDLPPPLRQQLTAMSPGEVTQPLNLPNAVALFQLRDIDEVRATGTVRELEYAMLHLPGGRSPEALAEAARIDARVDTCDDLYAVASGLPADRLQRRSQAPAQVPTDIALELAQLDENEVSTGLTRADGQTLVFLMLCRRSYFREDAPDAQTVRERLVNQQVSRRADNYLAELRANATIVRP